MIEEVPVRRMNRRTRGERNKRRERYFIFDDSNNYETESDVLTDDVSPPHTPNSSENNNFIKNHQKPSPMGKPKTVRDLYI
ncbi:hypothetical protein BDFB_000114 [Asbolus verrucosus]|uniref:Uncharacterized protein n=1 Tax=Asbolus verrucosus TaxID=1661398 RepID=A0A482VCU5_ASBVE|nr:hypothetical protein BDFB_000114 [Asbolus verrucosus]